MATRLFENDPVKSYPFEVYRKVLEDAYASGYRGIGTADIAEGHRKMQAGLEPASGAERFLREHLRRHLEGASEDEASEAVGS